MLGSSLPHSDMDQHLTVKEAVKLTGKSESTIKRLIREVVKESNHVDRDSILPPHDDVERRREAGEPYIWKIDRQLLLRRFPQEESTEEGSKDRRSTSTDNNSAPIIEVLREQLQSKDRQLQTLETQLDRKDEQIGALNERMRESNILMKELQEKVAIAAPLTKPQDAEVVIADDESKSKEGSVDSAHSKIEQQVQRDSLWSRPIHLFRKPRK